MSAFSRAAPESCSPGFILFYYISTYLPISEKFHPDELPPQTPKMIKGDNEIDVQTYIMCNTVGIRDEFVQKSKLFFIDDPSIWPLKESSYNLGHVPKLSDLLPPKYFKTAPLSRERTIHGIYCERHNASVRLASQIFGDLQRRATRSWDQERRRISL